MVFIDFCCLLQKLTNASAIITGVIQTLLVRIPWAHTFALAKLDSMEMEKSAMVTITILFYAFLTFAFWLAVELTYLPFKVTKVLYSFKSNMYRSELTNNLKKLTKNYNGHSRSSL